MNALSEKIQEFLSKKPIVENVTFESSLKSFNEVLNGIKGLKGQVEQFLKNVPAEKAPDKTFDWEGLTSDVKGILAMIETKVKKSK